MANGLQARKPPETLDLINGADELFALEAELQASGSRQDQARLEALLDPNFREFGSSGAVYDRLSSISLLLNERSDEPDIEMIDKVATPVSDSVVLLTYQAVRRDRRGDEISRSLRSSLWRRSNGGWTILFHQGTKR